MTEQSHSNSGNAKPPISGGKALFLLLALVVVAVILAVTGIIPRLRARTQLQGQTNALSAPDVLVGTPTLGQPSQEVILPGSSQAYTDAGIFARTNGYLKKWYFDIGAHVKQGQLLAVIESPEVDQQLAQAQADVATAQATAQYAQTQSARYQDLYKSNAVAKQDADNFTSQAASTSTQVQSAVANVQRLEQLTGFEKIYAPFDGTITARSVDTGTLIDSGAAKELFHLSAENVLRVFVSVPQVDSQVCVPGLAAGLTLTEFPGRTFEGKIVRTSKSIDPASRTLLVEVDVNNSKGELLPGSYMQIHFKINNPRPSLIVPVSALMFRSEGLRVALVQDGKAKLVPIVIGRDDGKAAEIIQGIEATDHVILDPPDAIIEGEPVHVVKPQQNAPQGGGQ